MMVVRLCLLVLLLASCGKPPADGYSFEHPEYERQQVVVRTVQHASLLALRDAARRAGAIVEPRRELMAWSVLSADRATCTVHIVDPRTSYAPEWLGHEMAHCVYGRWHD